MRAQLWCQRLEDSTLPGRKRTFTKHVQSPDKYSLAFHSLPNGHFINKICTETSSGTVIMGQVLFYLKEKCYGLANQGHVASRRGGNIQVSVLYGNDSISVVLSFK